MGAYTIICRGKTAVEAWSFFEKADPPFVPFRDAISGQCTYNCTVLISNIDSRLSARVRIRHQIRMVQSFNV
jgi:hypothetical protein